MKTVIIMIISILSTTMSGCSEKEDTIVLSVDLSEKEKQDLIFLREEEKLARDVYLYAFAKYEMRIFDNISQSEQRHMDKLLDLLNFYNIEDPVINERGKFSNNELQQIYSDLTAQVDISLENALTAGATIEDLDINDIDDFEKNTQKADILNVYGKLKCGSRNHLRSFTNQLELRALDYEPQFISVEEYNNILDSDNERCGGRW